MRLSFLPLTLLVLPAGFHDANAEEIGAGGSCDAGQHDCTGRDGAAGAQMHVEASRSGDADAASMPVTKAHEYCIIGAG